nr:sigma factor [Desulfitobacterium sp. PCE1]
MTVTSKKYGRFSKSIAYHILSNHEDADECINDAYLGVWNAIPPQRLKK